MSINLGSAYGEIQIGVGDAQRNVQSLADTLTGIGTKLSLGVSAPIIGVGIAGLQAAGDFQQALAQIGVASGATSEQMAAMQQQALDLGAETSFSAGEAADAMLELSKAGLDANETMAAVPGVLDLAAAGGLELAQAAEIASNAMNAFALPAESMPEVANLLAAAANASSVEVTDLADSMKMSASVMSTYGQSIEDTTTALAILGNQGLKGSDAGTSLKQMFLSMAAPTQKASDLMNELGINIYDAQGNMLEMPAILEELRGALFEAGEATVYVGGRTQAQNDELERLQKAYARTKSSLGDYQAGSKGAGLNDDQRKKKLAELNKELTAYQGQINALMGIQGTATTVTRQLTEEERNAAMATLFGSDAVRAANILLQAGTEEWDKMSAAVTKEGAASAMANARMNGLNGAIEYIKGTIDSLLIETFLPFLDSLSGAIRWIADLMAGFNDLSPAVKNGALAFLAVLAAIGPVMLGISGMITLFGALLSPIGLIGLAVAGLAAAFASNFLGIRGLVDGFVSQVSDMASKAKAAFDLAAGGVNGLVAAIATLGGGTVNVDLDTQITDVDWGDFHYKYDATSLITYVDWGNFHFVYDAAAGIATVDWGSFDLTYTYDALTKITTVNWQGDGNLGTFIYDATAGIISIDWTGQVDGTNLAFSYDSSAGIKYVEWNEELFHYVYDAEAGVTKVDFGKGLFHAEYSATSTVESVLWGVYQHFYSANATIDRVAWGAWQHLYDAQAGIDEKSVLWGAWEHTYNALSKVSESSVLWGLWSHSYDAKAAVKEDSILWGLFTHTYDVEAGVSTFKIMGMSVSEFGKWIASNLIITSPLAGFGIGTEISQADKDMQKGMDNIHSSWDDAWEGMQKTWESTQVVFDTGWTTVQTWLTTTLPAALTTLRDDFSLKWTAIKTTWDTIQTGLVTGWTVVQTWLNTTLPAALTALQTAWDTAWNAIRTTWDTVRAALVAGFNTVNTWFTVTLPGALSTLQGKFESAWSAIESAVTSAISPITSAISGLAEFMTTTLPAAANSLKDFLAGLVFPNPFAAIASIIDSIGSKIQAIIDAFNRLKDALSNFSLPDWLQPFGLSAASLLAPAVATAPAAPGGSSRMGDGGVNVSIHVDHISSAFDLEEVAIKVGQRVSDEIRRRQR